MVRKITTRIVERLEHLVGWTIYKLFVQGELEKRNARPKPGRINKWP